MLCVAALRFVLSTSHIRRWITSIPVGGAIQSCQWRRHDVSLNYELFDEPQVFINFSQVGQVSWGGTRHYEIWRRFSYLSNKANDTQVIDSEEDSFPGKPIRWWWRAHCPPSSTSWMPHRFLMVLCFVKTYPLIFSQHTHPDDTHVRLPRVNRKQHRARLVQSASRITLKVGCEFYFSIQSGLLVNRF